LQWDWEETERARRAAHTGHVDGRLPAVWKTDEFGDGLDRRFVTEPNGVKWCSI
jgi:hypothetical protein